MLKSMLFTTETEQGAPAMPAAPTNTNPNAVKVELCEGWDFEQLNSGGDIPPGKCPENAIPDLVYNVQLEKVKGTKYRDKSQAHAISAEIDVITSGGIVKQKTRIGLNKDLFKRFSAMTTGEVYQVQVKPYAVDGNEGLCFRLV